MFARFAVNRVIISKRKRVQICFLRLICIRMVKETREGRETHIADRFILSAQLLQNIPSCENLPPTSDDASCINLEPSASLRPNGTSLTSVDPSLRQSTSLLIVLLSILIPLAIICLLFIIFCWCCHQRNNNSHLSSCSTSSTPIKKPSHLVNTVTSSPFRSSIVATHPSKSHPRHFPPSSSSSANTNLTNAYLRQTLLRSEAKRPTLPIPLPNHSLGEISYSNIRLLQELGEGLFPSI